ncbi:P-loop containing nucleoside triphosphate hydrolase protein [Trametes cingulata]|nr:P-loop containing nucleoside triphosphate hydrolase protein [Trametes cingulata]
MAPKTRTIYQNLLDDDYPPILLEDEVLESKLTKEQLDGFFQGIPAPRRVGLAPIYSESGTLCRLAVAVSTKVLIIQFHAKGKGAKAYKGRELLSSEVLCSPDVLLFAFDLNKLAIALFTDQSLRILNGIDVQSSCGTAREPLAVIKFAAGDAVAVMEQNVAATFESSVLDSKRMVSLALQAWIAQCLPTFPDAEDRFHGAKRINTHAMPDVQLRAIAGLERGEHRLATNAPTQTKHDYASVGTRVTNAELKAERFQTRFRNETTQRVVVHDPRTGLDVTVEGTVESVHGRKTMIKTNINLEGRFIKSIVTEGRDRPTLADHNRETTMLHAMQGNVNLFDNPFLQYIFQPADTFTWPETFPISDTLPPIVSTRPLNDSQEQAVNAMLSNTDNTRVTIVQGPPGTGKTTVIAAFVTSAVAAGVTGIWLMAQSNIAVKNIAEKLADVGFENWRLLVSNDFHVGWHEHIYQQITRNIITSGEFRRAHDKIRGVPVILCTLSMLSHPRIHIFTQANPIKIMVVDEASQITLGNYISPLQTYPSIHKLCMIGDDKQCSVPPYGSEADENMQSIFEVDHLRPSAIFLDTQYRMPPLIGDIVSEVIYDEPC